MTVPLNSLEDQNAYPIPLWLLKFHSLRPHVLVAFDLVSR